MDTSLTRPHGAYVVSDDPSRLDLAAMHSYLKRSYWAEEIPLAILERAVRGSLCIGAYTATGAQVGLVRCISDFATFCYLCDVYVLEEHRGQGLSKAMMALVVEHPQLQGLRRWSLVTNDAHGLYEQFGFAALANPERFMERTVPDIYKRMARQAR